METRLHETLRCPCLMPRPGLRLMELRRELLLRTGHIKHPLFNEMNKSATFLSEREIQVLSLISFGFSLSVISDRLSLSIHTVNNHRKNMLACSRCATIAELVRIAMMEHVI